MCCGHALVTGKERCRLEGFSSLSLPASTELWASLSVGEPIFVPWLPLLVVYGELAPIERSPTLFKVVLDEGCVREGGTFISHVAICRIVK